MSSERRSERAWRELVRRQERSGLTARAFCEREGINEWTFYGWRSRLGALRGRAAQPTATEVVRKAPEPFIDLGTLTPSALRCEIQLELGGGVVLRVVRS